MGRPRRVGLAVARGEVSLVLRSLTDNATGGPQLVSGGDPVPQPSSLEQPREGRSSHVTLIRYGRAQQVALAGDE